MDEIRRPKFLQTKTAKWIGAVMVVALLVGALVPMTVVAQLIYWLVVSGVFALLLVVAAILGALERCWFFTSMMVVAVALMVYVIFWLILPNIQAAPVIAG